MAKVSQNEMKRRMRKFDSGQDSSKSGTLATEAGTENRDLVDAASSEGPKEEKSYSQKQIDGLKAIFISPLNLLLVFVFFGVYSGQNKLGCLPTFTCNFIAIIPLAAILGGATEAIAAHTGQLIGGLLNATFGNAVEMIVTINAIKAGLVTVVQGSLIGSIISNLLLVLGMAFIASGFIAKESGFNSLGAGTNITCLVLASLALMLPTVYTFIPDTTADDTVLLSRLCAIVMAVIYVLFLVFQLGTHSDSFSADEEEEEAELSVWIASAVLFGATCLVALCSEYLVDSIEGVSEQYGLPKAFIGLILLPIVGNAAEHMTAVTCAMKGKMDLTIGVAVGSSTQIALLVVPFSVVVGWIYDVPMSLDFRIFMAAVFILSVFIASSVLGDGAANWFEGCMLVATYLLIAIITWFIPEEHDAGSHVRELGTFSFSTMFPSMQQSVIV